jgi:hypothetical protein
MTKTSEPNIQKLRDAFEGMKGRQPTSTSELKKWLKTDEGKQATMFEATDLSLWGEMHAGAVRDPAEEEGFRSENLHE